MLVDRRLLLQLLRPARSVRIAELLAFVVSQDQVVALAAHHVFGKQRDLPAPLRRVDDVAGHRVARRVPAQALDDFQPLPHLRAEVGGADDGVALVEIVRLHARLQQAVHEPLHGVHVVIDAREEHRLAAKGNAGIGKPRTGLDRFRGELIGVREMDADPEGMVALQDPGEGNGDALRHHDGCLGADPQELHVRNPVQPGEQPVQLFLRQRQGVTAREQDVANLLVRLDVGDRLFPLRLEEDAVVVGVLHHARARAVAAVGGAGIGHEKQHPVGIAVHDAGNGAVLVLAERVFRLSRGMQELVGDGDHGPADRMIRILRVHQAEIVRGDGEGQRAGVPRDRGPFVIREPYDPLQLVDRANAIAQLPPPVAPFGGRCERKKARAERL